MTSIGSIFKLLSALVCCTTATKLYTSFSNETCNDACSSLGEVCDETFMNRIASLHDSCLNAAKGIFWTREIVETYSNVDPNLRCLVSSDQLNNLSAPIEVYTTFEDQSRNGYCSSGAPQAWRRICICQQTPSPASSCWKYSDTWFNAYDTSSYGIWPIALLVAWIVTCFYYLFSLWTYVSLTNDIFEVFWFSSPFLVSARSNKAANFMNSNAEASSFLKYHNKAYLWIGMYTAERVIFRSLMFSAWFNTKDVDSESFVCPEILYYIKSVQPLSAEVVHWFDSIGRTLVVVAFAGAWMAWGGKLPVAKWLFTTCQQTILANGLFLFLTIATISMLLLLFATHTEDPSNSTISDLFLSCFEGILGLSLVLMGGAALTVLHGRNLAEILASLKGVHINHDLLVASISGFVAIGTLEIICAAFYHQYQEYMLVPTMLFRSMMLPASEVVTVFFCLLTLTSQIDNFSALELLPGSTHNANFSGAKRGSTNEFCIEDVEQHDDVGDRYAEETKDEPSSPLVTLRPPPPPPPQQQHQHHQHDRVSRDVSMSISDTVASRSRSFSDSTVNMYAPSNPTNRGPAAGTDDEEEEEEEEGLKPSSLPIIVNESMRL